MPPTTAHIAIDMERLAEICRRYQVRELALFGSVLRDDFSADSDVDVLVEFEPNSRVDLFDFIALQRELGAEFGISVDLTERSALQAALRDAIARSSQVIYAT